LIDGPEIKIFAVLEASVPGGTLIIDKNRKAVGNEHNRRGNLQLLLGRALFCIIHEGRCILLPV